MRKILMLAVSFMMLLTCLAGVFTPPAAADPECAIPSSFYQYCAEYCEGFPYECFSEVVCVSPVHYECLCWCPL